MAAGGGMRPQGGENPFLNAKCRWPMTWRPVGIGCPNHVRLGLVRVCMYVGVMSDWGETPLGGGGFSYPK